MSENTAVEPVVSVAAVRKAFANTSKSLAEILQDLALAPETQPFSSTEPTAPAPITEELRVQLAKLPQVYGKVNPTTVRALTPAERVEILTERETLDVTVKTLGDRKKDVQQILANDIDEHSQANLPAEVLFSASRDDRGHFLLKDAVEVPELHKKISREVRHGSPTIDADLLLAAYEAGEFTREEYLSLTKEVRVFDEARARKAIEKTPELLAKVAEFATVPGKKVGAIYVRKG